MIISLQGKHWRSQEQNFDISASAAPAENEWGGDKIKIKSISQFYIQEFVVSLSINAVVYRVGPYPIIIDGFQLPETRGSEDLTPNPWRFLRVFIKNN